jgi:hypothetical protein
MSTTRGRGLRLPNVRTRVVHFGADQFPLAIASLAEETQETSMPGGFFARSALHGSAPGCATPGEAQEADLRERRGEPQEADQAAHKEPLLP